MNMQTTAEDMIWAEPAPTIGQEKEYEKRQRNLSSEWSLNPLSAIVVLI